MTDELQRHAWGFDRIHPPASKAPMAPDELKALRKREGLTLRELAELLRISDRKTIQRWENGERPVTGPSSIVLELLASGELPARYRQPGVSAPATGGIAPPHTGE